MTIEVLDPRPPGAGVGQPVARRLGQLDGARLLLFDNGKLSPRYGHRHAILDVLRAAIERRAADAVVLTRAHDLLVPDLAGLAELADEVAAGEVDAVVLALVDAGVGMPTAVLATELEARGVPTCTICEGPGLGVAAAAARTCPDLALVQLPVLQGQDEPAVRGFASAIADDVLDCLVGPPRLRAGDVDVRLPGSRSAAGTVLLDDLREDEDPTLAFTRLMAEDGLGDGFPLVPPTAQRVAALLDACTEADGSPADPAQQVWPRLPVRGAPVLLRDVAVVAALAGVEPRWMPVVRAAYQGMAEPTFRLFQAAITTHPGGTLVLVSGPRAGELAIASGAGCLGPGHRANAAIGRAAALGLPFLLASLPGGADLTIQGSPAEYAYCCAEDVEASPWPSLATELTGAGPDATTVTVLRCEGPKNVLDHLSDTPEGLLTSVASACATVHSNNAYLPGAQTVVFLNPAHARLVAGAGWSRRDVQEFLFLTARNPRSALAGRGIGPLWPASFDGLDPVPVATGPESFLVVVAGAPGLASQVAIPWGLSRAATTLLA